MTPRRCLAVLAVVVALAGCGGSSGGAAAPPASPSPAVDTGPAAQAAVTAAWEGFFKAGGSVDNHIALLEEGEKFRAELTKQASDPASNRSGHPAMGPARPGSSCTCPEGSHRAPAGVTVGHHRRHRWRHRHCPGATRPGWTLVAARRQRSATRRHAARSSAPHRRPDRSARDRPGGVGRTRPARGRRVRSPDRRDPGLRRHRHPRGSATRGR